MEDYAKGQEKENFLTDVIKEDDGTLSLVFADGKRYTGFADDEETRKAIEKKLETQAKLGISRKKKFVRNRNLQEFLTGTISTVGIISAASAIHQTLQYQNPAKLLGLCIFGGVALIGSGACMHFRNKNESKIGQIKAIEYLVNEGQAHIREIMKTPNGMVGIPQKNRTPLVEAMEYPFMNIDSIDLGSLERVVINGKINAGLDVTYTDKATEQAQKVFVKRAPSE